MDGKGRSVIRMLGLATINLYTKVSTFTHYKDMKGDEKCRNWGGLKPILQCWRAFRYSFD